MIVVLGTGLGIDDGLEEEDGAARALAAGVLRTRGLVTAAGAWIWPSEISETMPSALAENGRAMRRRRVVIGCILWVFLQLVIAFDPGGGNAKIDEVVELLVSCEKKFKENKADVVRKRISAEHTRRERNAKR